MDTKTGISTAAREARDRRPNPPLRTHSSGHGESFAQQLCAAACYAFVAITVLIIAVSSFSDDFGLGQAGIALCPLTLLSLWTIRRRPRR